MDQGLTEEEEEDILDELSERGERARHALYGTSPSTPPVQPQPASMTWTASGWVPYRQSLQIENITQQERDVWWLPTEGPRRRLLPRKVQTNIQANSSRTTHVAAQGDKFLIVNSGTGEVIPYQPDGYSRYGPIITTNRTFSHFMLTSDGVCDIHQ